MACKRRDPLDFGFARTTYEASYVDHKKPKDKVYRQPIEHVDNTRQRRRKPYIPKAMETLYPWKRLMHSETFMRPKRITRTHPQELFDPNFRLKKESNEEIRKRKPKVYMVPAICMNDIQDPEIYKTIVDNMYTTDWRKKDAEVGTKCCKRNLPNTVYEVPNTCSLRYEYDMISTYPPDWLEKCKEWDSKYPGQVVNQTEIFWQDFKSGQEQVPAGKNPFQFSVDPNIHEKIHDLVEKDELRQYFDIPKGGYTGYRPVRDVGPLRKKDIYVDPNKRLLTKEFLDGKYKNDDKVQKEYQNIEEDKIENKKGDGEIVKKTVRFEENVSEIE